MSFTKEDVDVKFKEIEDFERIIPGIRYGEDYPQFALAVISSKAFVKMVQSATMVGLLGAIVLPGKIDQFPDTKAGGEALLDEMSSKGPMRDAILRALYLGYKLGKLAND